MKAKFVVLILVLLLFVSGCKTINVNTEPTKTDLTVIMYHSFLKDSTKSGKYIITPTQFENDIIYLKSIGCSFVSVKDIDAFRKGTGSLPSKSVLLTFDDGNYNNYSYIFPLIKKYNIPVLISPICYWVEKYTETGDKNPIYAILDKSAIKEMYDSGLVEFGNHTYNLHSTTERFGTCKISSESTQSYQEFLYNDLKKADNIIMEITGKSASALVYPYGMISPESYDVARKMGYDILFSCTEGINHIHPGDNRYLLKRYNRPSGISSEDFFSEMFSENNAYLK